MANGEVTGRKVTDTKRDAVHGMKVKGEIPLWKRSGLKAAINESTKYQHRTIQFCSAEA